MLDTTYKDDKFSGKRKYRMIQNDDGTVSFDDVTDYVVVGTEFGAADLNEINDILKRTKERYGYKMLCLGETYNLISNSKSDIKTLPFSTEVADCAVGDFSSVNNGLIKIKKDGHLKITLDILNSASATSKDQGLVDVFLRKNDKKVNLSRFHKPQKMNPNGEYSHSVFTFTFSVKVSKNDVLKVVACCEDDINKINTHYHRNSSISLEFYGN